MTADPSVPADPRAPLDVDQLRERLVRAGSPWTSVEVVEATGSTNADLRRDAESGAAEGCVLAAEEQLAGRGRLGRSWQAPARTSLAVSFLLRPPGSAVGAWGWLPLLTGLAVAEAVEAVTSVPARLKWPNDVVVGAAKLAGILAERVTTSSGPAAVVGVGLNVSQSADELPFESAVSLAGCGAGPVDRTVLAATVLERVAAHYLTWQVEPQTLRLAYLGRSDTVGALIRADLPGGQVVTGTATDVDTAGRLVVASPQGAVEVAAADVVHLR